MLTTYEQRSKRKLTATILSVVIIAGVVVFADHYKSGSAAGLSALHSTSSPTSSSSTAAPTTPATSSTAASGYQDGTFTATSHYYVPSGNESIQVSLTLKNGAVTGASVQNSEGDPTSAMFQHDFASAYKSYVIGQKISSLQLDAVGGASDTSQGFDEAVRKISSEAQA